MGKDYFFDRITDSTVGDSYSIWSQHFTTIPWLSGGRYNRCKFANQLKLDVSQQLSITVEELDLLKDRPLQQQHLNYQWKHISPPENPTYRHILIDIGNYMRSIDPDYWLKMAARDIIPGMVNVITDWRFPNETNIERYTSSIESVTTVRVHRAGVPIPSINLGSEHLLNDYRPDLLVISRDDQPADHGGWMWQYVYKVL